MKKRIGIFGGGQLGAYLCQAARRLDLETYVVCFSEDSMATAYADHVLVCRPDDTRAATWLGKNADVVTFEIEDVPASVLTALDTHNRLTVAPSSAVMRLLQNKLTQKQWLVDNGFPTAPFRACSPDSNVSALGDELGYPFVQKRQRGGYDGRGVQIIDKLHSHDRVWRDNALAEQYIGSKREIAVLVARSVSGEMACYPIIEMSFDPAGNVLSEARSPAQLSDSLSQEAQKLAGAIVERLEGAGIFAVEMFIDATGSLLINEISPRVHNTGHLTMEGFTTCQYEQHLRALTGMPMGSLASKQPAAVMLNVLYQDTLRGLTQLGPGRKLLDSNVTLHWYGKPPGTALRKMGHITCTADSLNDAAAQAHNALTRLNRNPEKAA